MTKAKEKWCQTVELPAEQKVPEDMGTHVWGWVEKSPNGSTGKYVIKVFSAASSWGESADGTLSIKFFGDMNISDSLTIQDHGFNRGEITEVEKSIDMVGNIIIAQVTYGGSKPQLCNKIQVSMSYRIWHFPCTKLFEPGKKETLPASGNVGYAVTFDVKTGCKDPMWITIYGNAGTTITQVLTDHGMTAGAYKTELLGDFVGDMFKIKVDKVPGCQFIISKVSVKYSAFDGEFESGFEKAVDVMQIWQIPKKPKDEPAKPPKKGAIIPPPKECEPKECLEKSLGGEDAGKFFDGRCLPEKEYKEAEANKLGCDTTFGDIIDKFSSAQDGPASHFILPQAVLFRCPPGCMKPDGLETTGALIHPSGAKVCVSAWADRATDTNGGVIQVQLTNSQESQEHPMWEKTNGVTLVGGSSKQAFAFVTAKVDNTSMTLKRVRLVNGDKIDVVGRLEIKIESKWTTVKEISQPPQAPESATAMMAKLAGSVCKYMGQKGGTMNGTMPAPLNQNFPQHEIYCHKASDAFPCEIRADKGDGGADPPPIVPDHSQDVAIMCTKKDLSAPSPNGPGSATLSTPYEGATSDFPMVITPEGQKALMCVDVFQSKDEEANKLNALVFCKANGHTGIDTNFLIPQQATNELKKNRSLVFAKSISNVNVQKMKVEGVSLAEDPCQFIARLKCKGAPSPPVIKANPKDQGRIPGPKITKIQCSDSPKDLELTGVMKGDPGSVFTFICPPGCSTGGTLIGAGLQAFKSPICMAAIQQQIIGPNEENQVSIVIGIPKFQQYGRKNTMKIESENFPATKEFAMDEQPITFSYAVIKTQACQLLGSLPDFQFSQKKMHVRKNQKIKQTQNHNNYNNLISKQNNSSNNISFIQTRTKGKDLSKQYQLWFAGAVPDFYYAPLTNELRDLNIGKQNESIDLSQEPGHYLTQDLGEGQTIIVGFNIESLPSNEEYITIFSHSANGCQEFVLKDLNTKERPPSMTFRHKGKEGAAASFNTLITPKIGAPVHVVLSQQKGEMRWQMNGERQIVQQANLDMSEFLPEVCTGGLMLGNNGGNKYMSGTIYQWALFRQIWDSKIARHFHESVKTTILLPKGGGSAGGSTTIDGRACIGPAQPAPPPPSPTAPKAPEPLPADEETKKLLAKESTQEEGAEELTNSSDPAVEAIAEDLAEKNPEMEEKLMDGPAEELGGDLSACITAAKAFYTEEGLTETEPGDFSQTGKKITCPEKCPEKAGKLLVVFGPEKSDVPTSKMVFGLDSAICGAAIYAGVFDGEEGGSVLIHLVKSKGPLVKGEESFGIRPKSADAASTGVFYMSPSPPPIKLECLDLASDTKIEKTDGKKAQVVCPKKCYDKYQKSKPLVIFGSMSNGYSYNSSICLAAMHAGLLSNDRKATLSIQVSQTPDEPREYDCFTSATMDECEDVRGLGIQSGKMKFNAGFLFVDPVYACAQQKDNTAVPIMKRYKIIENMEEEYIFKGPIITPKNQSPDLSKVINKNFDCGNSAIEIAFSLTEGSKKMGATKDEQFGIIFRQINIGGNEAYYLLRFDKEGVELQQIEKGAYKTVIRENVNFDIVTGVATYDVKITQIADDIKVEIMKEPEMLYRELFTVKEASIHRGAVGFEKKGLIDINIIVFEVKDPRSKWPKEHILVEPQVRSIDLNMVESTCEMYKKPAINDERMHTLCSTTLGYCNRSCKKFHWYKNHYYNCLKQCHKKQDEWLKAKEAGKEEASFPCKEIMPGQVFEKNLKVDYKSVNNCQNMPNENEYMPAWVAEAEQIGEVCMFTIRQICNQGTTPNVVEVKETDKLRFSKCGDQLKARKEDDRCNEKVQEGKKFDELNKLKNRV